MPQLHCYYWLLASGGTLLDGFSVVALGIDMTITPVLIGLIGSALVCQDHADVIVIAMQVSAYGGHSRG
jgi:hypothetical protein